MNDLLQDDAWHVLNEYGAGTVTDPLAALDTHRLFAFELLCDGFATVDECKGSIRSLTLALNLVTGKRGTQPTNSVLSEEV
ncbi:hypothetical protein ACIPYR_21900 [Streptomyces parvus]|uniref:hypothetical protein n=1 Tax=Streptomyces parvus TaxID=66428 RepID=UPI0037FDC37F